jgi:hypothetical protein
MRRIHSSEYQQLLTALQKSEFAEWASKKSGLMVDEIIRAFSMQKVCTNGTRKQESKLT